MLPKKLNGAPDWTIRRATKFSAWLWRATGNLAHLTLSSPVITHARGTEPCCVAHYYGDAGPGRKAVRP
jgi:hypothetical protein